MIDEMKLRNDIYTAFCDNCTYATKLCCDNNCKIHQVIRIIDMQSHLSLDTEPDKGMAKAKREITISRDYFKMVAEKVINNIGNNVNTEAYVPFAEDCKYIMSVLECELFGRDD